MALAAVSVTSNPNKGRQIQPIVGIQGISTGGQLLMNGPVNSRVHRGSFQCSGFGYGMLSPGTTITLEAGDTGTGTFTPVMGTGNNIGQVTGVTIGNTNSSKGAGTYPLTITDAVGVGATGTYTVNGSNVITAAAIVITGLTGPIPPDLFFPASIQHKVNGIIMRDIFAADILAQVYAQKNIIGYIPRAGELPFYYTEPWRNVNRHNDTTSWDLVNQSTWTIQANIASTVGAPAVTGWYEFDYIRNARAQTGNGAAVDINGNVVAAGKTGMFPFVQPIRHHSYQNTVPGGVSNINWLPFDFPIVRMWFNETGPGSITQIEIWEDSNQIELLTFEQGLEAYGAYGFTFGKGTVTDTSQTGGVVNSAWNNAQAFSKNFKTYDGLFISDPDQRLFKALIVAKQFIVKVTSTANTNLNVFMETLPGAYK
jgi:hypothetical protein